MVFSSCQATLPLQNDTGHDERVAESAKGPASPAAGPRTGIGHWGGLLQELSIPSESESESVAEATAPVPAAPASASTPAAASAETAPAAPSSVGNGADIGKLVAGGFTVISTSIAIVGGITGAVSRFLRNNPIPLLAALVLSVAAVGVSLVGSQLVMANLGAKSSGVPAGSRDFDPEVVGAEDPDKRSTGTGAETRKRARAFRQRTRRYTRILVYPTTISFILFSLAALITVFYLEKSLASSDRPRITSAWTEIGRQPVLSVTVKISDMKVTDTLNVSVRAVTTSDSGDQLAGLVVYSSETGADSAGDGDLSFSVPLPSGYDGLRVVANLGTASVTCNGTQILTPSSPSPSPIPTSDTPVPVTRMPDNTIAPVFSCMTAFAPDIAPAQSPSPAVAQ